MSSNQNVLEIVAYIKKKIERCIKKYMSMEQTMTYLQENYQSAHLLTRTIWERLQRDNPDFFKEYYKRCEVARQIATFNDLVAQQVDMMHKFREVELSYVEPATQFQKPNDQHHPHQYIDQIHDQGIASNYFACIEESIYSLIDPALIAAPPESYLPTSSFNYDIGFQDISSEQFFRDLDEKQEISQPNSQQPQHLTDHQIKYCTQEHDDTTLPVKQGPPQSLASNNLNFGDGLTNNNGSNITAATTTTTTEDGANKRNSQKQSGV